MKNNVFERCIQFSFSEKDINYKVICSIAHTKSHSLNILVIGYVRLVRFHFRSPTSGYIIVIVTFVGNGVFFCNRLNASYRPKRRRPVCSDSLLTLRKRRNGYKDAGKSKQIKRMHDCRYSVLFQGQENRWI